MFCGEIGRSLLVLVLVDWLWFGGLYYGLYYEENDVFFDYLGRKI